MTSPPITNSRHRYFYTDPLAASWMAKHFGMRFIVQEYGDCSVASQADWRLLLSETTFMVHRDSLHLLEPQILDVIMCQHFGPSTARMVNNDVQRQLASNYQSRIIQRNGVAFHWPESEAV